MKHVAAILALASLALAGAPEDLVKLQAECDAAKLGRVEKYKTFKPRFERWNFQTSLPVDASTSRMVRRSAGPTRWKLPVST